MEYGLIGEKLGHSYSERIHRMLGNDAYGLYPMPHDEMIHLMKTRAFRGLNVTIPYKRDVMQYCDVLSDEVTEIGSANTLVMRDGKLTAYNTDLGGFMSLAKRAGVEIGGKKAAVLGSGGTSLTAQAACKRLGAREIIVVSRKGPVNYEELYRDHADVEVLINTTPVGMYPNNMQSVVELNKLQNLTGVLDVVYNPHNTQLVMQAHDRGIPAIGGLWMLIMQAKLAAEKFFDAEIPDAKVEEIYHALLMNRLNIVLIGMPGAGKTTVGKALAERLGRPFVDCDQEIERITGKSIPEIFAESGETIFRDIETEVIYRLSKESGLVIATGGGAPMYPRNIHAIEQNGVMLHLMRPVDALQNEGRPLSGDVCALRAMEKIRLPIYRSYAQIHVDNSKSVTLSVEQAIEQLSHANEGR